MAEVFGAAPFDQAPIALFVNADDLTLSREYEYGPTVKRVVLDAVLTVDELRRCQLQTSWGSLMLPALRWAGSSSDGGVELTNDPFLLWSSACALCRSDGSRWSRLGAHAPWILGTSNIYMGVLSRLPGELCALLDEGLRAYSWYIGAMEVDPNDLLHRKVFSLVPGWRYSQGWVDQPGEGGVSSKELFAGTAVSGVGLEDHPIPEHHCRIPWNPVPAPRDPQVRLGDLACHDGMTYQESIAKKIVYEYLQATRPLAFTVGRRQPLVDDLRDKLHDYALNPDHSVGGHKARVFKSALGMEQRDWKLLAIQLISALQAAEPLAFQDVEKWGKQQQLRFEIDARVVGLNGKTMAVTAVWKIEDDAPAQLLTLTPGDKPIGAADLAAINPGDWAGLYNIALTVAERARQECRPTPMALGGPEGVDVIPEGMAGFAWVTFPESGTEFVQWLLHAGHASESPPGAQICAPTFDLEPAAAWADAMAAVLQAAGHPCSVVQAVD
ncbi:DUF6883 domain-containing protein [Streptomyces sp. NPDC093510]|uniref:DUF6883 domain-containing protein n=1 Tax=Streptomyces sp. NPDC093510 TaxID=3155199 RepID=UPI003418960D